MNGYFVFGTRSLLAYKKDHAFLIKDIGKEEKAELKRLQNPDNRFLLKKAIEKGFFSIVKFLISQYKDLQAQKDKALILACYYKHYDLVKYLVSLGADVNAGYIKGPRQDFPIALDEKNYLPMFISAQSGNLSLVRFLVSKGAKIKKQALFTAAEHGHFEVVEFLLKNGVEGWNTNNTLVMFCAQYGQFTLLKKLDREDKKEIEKEINSLSPEERKKYSDEYKYDDFVVQIAAENGYLNIIKYRISAGDSIDGNGDNAPMQLACQNGHLHIVKYLISQGAMMDNTCLQEAGEQGQLNVLKYLIGLSNISAQHLASIQIKSNFYKIFEYLSMEEKERNRRNSKFKRSLYALELLKNI